MDRIGTRLRDARLALGLSLADAARDLLDPHELSLIESGGNIADADTAGRLAARVRIPFHAHDAIASSAHESAIALEASLRRGDWKLASELLTLCDPDTAHTRYCTAMVLERQGDFAGALTILEDLMAAKGVQAALRLRATSALCRCYRYAGDLQNSIAVAEAALATLAQAPNPDPEIQSELRATLAGTYCETGDLNRALDLTHDRDDDLQQSPWSIATQRWARSMVLQRAGRVTEAATAAFEALHILRTLDQPRTVARMQNNAAWLALQTADIDAYAIEPMLQESEKAFREVGALVDLTFVLTTRAEYSVRIQDFATARACVEEAMLLASGEDVGFRARITAAAAQIYASMGDREASMTHLLVARALLEDSGAKRSAAATWNEMAATYGALGQTDLQIVCLRAAMDLLDL